MLKLVRVDVKLVRSAVGRKVIISKWGIIESRGFVFAGTVEILARRASTSLTISPCCHSHCFA